MISSLSVQWVSGTKYGRHTVDASCFCAGHGLGVDCTPQSSGMSVCHCTGPGQNPVLWVALRALAVWPNRTAGSPPWCSSRHLQQLPVRVVPNRWPPAAVQRWTASGDIPVCCARRCSRSSVAGSCGVCNSCVAAGSGQEVHMAGSVLTASARGTVRGKGFARACPELAQWGRALQHAPACATVTRCMLVDALVHDCVFSRPCYHRGSTI